MSKLITRSVRCGLAAAAAMLSMPAAQAQQAPPVMAPAAAGALEEVLVTARRREESMQDVPIAVSAFSAERAAHAAGRRPRRPAGLGAEPEPGAGARFGQQRQHLHPRHRPAGRAADLRPRRRRLSRRRVRRAHPGRAVQPLRRAARRGAARPAGHALRQEHDRGRHQAHLEEAAGGTRRPGRARLRRLQSLFGQGLPRRTDHRQLRCQRRRRVRDARRHQPRSRRSTATTTTSTRPPVASSSRGTPRRTSTSTSRPTTRAAATHSILDARRRR